MAFDTYIRIRCSSEQKARWDEAAGRQPVSDWAREHLDRAARGQETAAAEARQPVEARGVTEPEGPVAPAEPPTCVRVVHHRPGVFCASCGSIPKQRGV